MFRIDQLLYRQEKPFRVKALLFPLYLLSIPYGFGVRMRVWLYSWRLLKSKKLPCPVISIGNITAGGTGKTPHVITLARGLMDRGIRTAILSRGYGGKGPTQPWVSDGEQIFLSPEESGDEPFHMAQVLRGIPILIGADRFKTGQLVLQRFPLHGLLLDDGYQHLKVHRDLNVLLIDSQIGFGDQHLLPRGVLREPLSHLRRADLFLLTKVEDLERCRTVEKLLRAISPQTPIFHSSYDPQGWVDLKGGWKGRDALQGKKVLALSGIAHPWYFHSLIKKSGAEIVKEMVFPDHHRFRSSDLIALERLGREVDWIVTTEKDLVRLAGLRITADLPMVALRIEAKLWEEKEFYHRVMEIFQTRG